MADGVVMVGGIPAVLDKVKVAVDDVDVVVGMGDPVYLCGILHADRVKGDLWVTPPPKGNCFRCYCFGLLNSNRKNP